MGCCGSTRVDRVDSSKTAEGKGESLVVPFMLKMPKVRQSIKVVEESFTSVVGTERHDISKTEIKQVLQVLGVKEEHAGEAELSKIWGDCKTSNLPFKKLAAGVGVVYVLENCDSKCEPNARMLQVVEGYLVVDSMFRKLDGDGSGEIDYSEMKAALTNFTRDKSIVKARMKEMDLDGNKTVDFAEFLSAFATWAGWEEDAES